MKNLILQELSLRNFKKVKDFETGFTQRTQISGDNGTGKTTVFDAYCWLLYGKNSNEESDFSIKTLDHNNEPIPKLEHEVIGKFSTDGVDIEFKRLYSEKWTKKRGNDFEELTGHETKYFIDEVPAYKNEYDQKVKEILDESVSKMISNPNYFNNQIGWKERRAILSDMAGEISDAVIVETASEGGNNLEELLLLLNSGKSLEDEKKKIGVQKKKLKDEIKEIPSKLSEVDRMKPEPKDYDSIKKKADSIDERIKSIDEQILDKSSAVDTQNVKVAEAKTDKFNKEEKLRDLARAQKVDNSAKDKAAEEIAANDLIVLGYKRESSEFTSSVSRSELRIEEIEKEQVILRAEWDEWNELKFDSSKPETCCPACKRDYDDAGEKIQTAEANFNSNRALNLKTRKEKGTANAEEIKRLKDIITLDAQKANEIGLKIEPIEVETIKLKEELNKPQEEFKPTAEMISLKAEIESIVIPEVIPVDVSELTTEKETISEELRVLKLDLTEVVALKKLEERELELNNSKKTLSQELASLERTEFQIDLFNKSKIDLIESRINSRFALVKFKMFEQQINGGEAPACVCMVDGVPYSDLNTAMKINASLDIINALQHHFGILAPVFVDQKESVSRLVEMECQLITLKVEEGLQKLEILNI